MPEAMQDIWAQWLLQRRHGGNPEHLQAMLKELFAYRDQVLSHASIAEGETVLDVGTGDGLIAFGALPQVGAAGKVIFSDVSQDLLDHCRALAEQIGMLGRCQFVWASADNLAAFRDASVDVVTTRSVLIYVANKPRALREFYRVLKPGGRVSLFEPINRFAYPEPPSLFFGYDMTPILGIAQKVKAAYGITQPLAESPMLDFDERTMLALAEQAGFTTIHLDYQVEIAPKQPQRWETRLHSSPNPLAPTLEEVIKHSLTEEEARQFIDHLRPLVEEGRGTNRLALTYLWAVKTAHSTP